MSGRRALPAVAALLLLAIGLTVALREEAHRVVAPGPSGAASAGAPSDSMERPPASDVQGPMPTAAAQAETQAAEGTLPTGKTWTAEAAAPTPDAIREGCGRVVGRVCDRAGRPIAEANVYPGPPDLSIRRALDGSTLGIVVTTTAQGSFAVDVAPDVYAVFVQRVGYAPARSAPVAVSANATADAGEIVLERVGEGKLVVRLVTAEGRPYEGEAWLFVAAEGATHFTTIAVTADATGLCWTTSEDTPACAELALTKGRYDVQARLAGFTSEAAEVEVRDAETTEAILRLVALPMLAIHAFDAATGAPAPGVSVYDLTDAVATPPQGESVETDGEGRCSLPMRRGERTISISSEDYCGVVTDHGVEGSLTVHVDDALLADGLVLKLDRGFEIAGRVVRADGSPVPQASVEMRAPNDHQQADVCDPSGRFRLKGLQQGPALISGQASEEPLAVGAVTVDVGTDRLSRDIEIVLLPFGSIAGRVLGPGGRPLVGASILVSRPGGDASPGDRLIACTRHAMSPWEVSGITETDAAGRFTEEGIPPGPALVRAQGEGLLTASREVQVTSGETVEVEIALEPSERIEGRILGGTLHVITTLVYPAGSQDVMTDAENRIDDDGRFSLWGMPRGSYDLEFIAYGGVSVHKANVRTGTTDLEVRLVRVARIVGRITGALRGPPPVDISARASLNGEELYASSATSGGRFAVEVDPAATRVEIAVPGFPPLVLDRLTLEPGMDLDATLQLAPSGELSGLVVDPQGRPLGRRAWVAATSGSGDGAARAEVGTDDIGRFHVTLAVGEILLRVESDGFAPKDLGPIHLEPGAEIDLGRIVLEPAPGPGPEAEAPK